MDATRPSSRRRRSTTVAAVPAASARATSARLASSTSAVRSSRSSAAATRAASLAAVDANASGRAAALARRPSSARLAFVASGISQSYRRRLAALVAAVALVAPSCGRDEAVEPDRVTACEVLTATEVAGVLGGPVDAPDAAEAPTDVLAGRSGCAWSRRDGSSAVLIELVRTADMSSSVRRTGFSASARFNAARNEHPQAVRVPDLGDDVLFVEEEGTLHVLAERTYLTFEVAATPTATIPVLAGELARKALARLRQADGAD